MGPTLSTSHPRLTFLLLGLDKSGKSTILYRMKRKAFTLCAQPTMGFNTERISHAHHNAVVQWWDLGGLESVRAIWPRYLSDCDALCFVVDATDRRRMDEVSVELNSALRHLKHGQDTPIHILLNKTDLPESMDVAELSTLLDVADLTRAGYLVSVFGVCGVTGEGLDEALSSIFRALATIKERQKQREINARNSIGKHALAKFAR